MPRRMTIFRRQDTRASLPPAYTAATPLTTITREGPWRCAPGAFRPAYMARLLLQAPGTKRSLNPRAVLRQRRGQSWDASRSFEPASRMKQTTIQTLYSYWDGVRAGR